MNESEFRQRFYQLRSKHRCRFDFAYKGETTAAAILVPIMCRDNLTILLTRRARHLHHHPDKLVFLGAPETADSSLIDTALREAQEEIALERITSPYWGNCPHPPLSLVFQSPGCGHDFSKCSIRTRPQRS